MLTFLTIPWKVDHEHHQLNATIINKNVCVGGGSANIKLERLKFVSIRRWSWKIFLPFLLLILPLCWWTIPIGLGWNIFRAFLATEHVHSSPGTHEMLEMRGAVKGPNDAWADFLMDTFLRHSFVRRRPLQPPSSNIVVIPYCVPFTILNFAIRRVCPWRRRRQGASSEWTEGRPSRNKNVNKKCAETITTRKLSNWASEWSGIFNKNLGCELLQ